MSTMREKSPGSRPLWHYLFVFIVVILWLAACGGGGSGQNAKGPVVVLPPLKTCDVDPGVKHDCPTGAICVGYVTGTSVGNIFPVVFGNRPDWSPDGQQIVFHREGSVYIVNADGSGEFRLATGTEPAWSPVPGNLIAFTSADGISVVNRDGTNYRTLASNDSVKAIHLSSPAWSPDGQRIAYSRLEGTESQNSLLYTMNADGSAPARITTSIPATAFERDPSLSPAGGSVAFTDFSLAFIDPFGDVVRTASGPASRPDWSPDGSLIAFATINQCRPNAPEIAVTTPGRFAPTVLLVNALQPAWSPDGARIAFATEYEVPGNGSFPQVYVRESPSDFGEDSRFILYEDNLFELQYRAGASRYPGSYMKNGSELLFNFHASSQAGRWQARGILDGDRLSVTFNIVMQLSDFENGTYVLTEI